MSLMSACTSPTLTQRGQAAGARTHVWPSRREKPQSSPGPHATPLVSEEVFTLMRTTSHQPVAHLAQWEMQTPALAALS